MAPEGPARIPGNWEQVLPTWQGQWRLQQESDADLEADLEAERLREAHGSWEAGREAGEESEKEEARPREEAQARHVHAQAALWGRRGAGGHEPGSEGPTGRELTALPAPRAPALPTLDWPRDSWGLRLPQG